MNIKNQIATDRFNSTVSDIEIIKNFFPTPFCAEVLTEVEIDSSSIKKSELLISLYQLSNIYF